MTESHCRNTLGTCLVNLGEGEHSLRELQLALDIAEEVRDPEALARAGVNLSHANLLLLRWDEGMRVARAGLAAARRLGVDRTHGVYIESNLVEALTVTGGWDEATEREASLSSRLPDGVWAYFTVGPLRADRGDLESLRRDVAGAPPLQEADALLQGLVRFVSGKATLALWDQRYGDVRPVIESALERAPAGLLDSFAGDIVWPGLRAEAERRSADSGATADRFLAAVEAAAADRHGIRPRLTAYLPLCRAEHDRVRGTDTIEDWLAVAKTMDDAGFVYPPTYARFRAAELAVRAGDREQAAELAAAAIDTTSALGAKPLHDAISDLQRRARLGSAASDESGGRFGLSPREREVLALVADGRTNRQIAQALFISPKTAAVHVSNVLGKLAVASRGEAAAVAHRLGLTNAS